MPDRRIVLLGASNLTVGFRHVVRAAQDEFTGPLDVMAALGHGRSFGAWSYFLYRSLPGIIDCRLWEDLAGREPAETFALVTDVGNDLVFGYDVDVIAGWVRLCLERLQSHHARIAITRLPMDSVRSLSPRRFAIARRLLFPMSNVTFEEILSRSHDLDGRISQFADEFGATLLEQSGDWYGIDPIHYRRRLRRRVWSSYVARLPNETGETTKEPIEELSNAKRVGLPWFWPTRLHAAHRRTFKRERRRAQPVLKRGRLTLSLY